MSPKIATISFTLLALTLTLTLLSGSAQANCPGFDSVSAILEHYKLPTSIFPANVDHFSCEHHKDSLGLTIKLKSNCTVVYTLGAIVNKLKCEDTISAVISRGKLTEVKGVTVQLCVKLLPWLEAQPFGPLMTITGAESSVGPLNIHFFKFTSDNLESPAFPYVLFPTKPPMCDTHDLEYYNDVNSNQDIPNKVSSFDLVNPIFVV